MKYFLLYFILVSSFLYTAPFCYFNPPKGWDLVLPSKFTNSTLMACVAHSHEPFRASMNLGYEVTCVTQEEYVKAVQKRFASERHHQWNEVGYIQTKVGKAHLTKLTTKHGFGQTCSLQAILVKDHTAYVVTAISLKEDFSNYLPAFIEAIESLSFYPSSKDSLSEKEFFLFSQKKEELLSGLSSLGKKKKENIGLEKTFEKKFIKPFEKFLDQHFREKGLGWRFMVCQEIAENVTLLNK